MEVNIKKLFIDSDSLLHQAAYINNHKDDCADEALALEVDGEEEDLGLDDAVNTDILEAMQSTFNSMVKAIVIEVQLEYPDIDPTPVLVLTVKNSSDRCADLEDNFRYNIMDSVEDPAVKGYKSNRAGMEVPDGLLHVYNYVFDLPNSVCIGGIEADDYCVYYGLQGHVVAALDKDVLKSLPYAYNFGKQEWVEYTESERRLWFYRQIVTGDSSDGLRGAYRVGDKWVDKNLLETDTELELWTKCVTAYFTKEQSLEEALATARAVNMTQWSPDNGLVLWQPPKKDK